MAAKAAKNKAPCYVLGVGMVSEIDGNRAVEALAAVSPTLATSLTAIIQTKFIKPRGKVSSQPVEPEGQPEAIFGCPQLFAAFHRKQSS